MSARYHNFVRHKGMTLMELMVTIGIMAIMVLAFGQIISTSQKAVSTSQAASRTTAAAAAIEKVIRDDLRKITRNGFLCITHDGDPTHAPRLVALTAGITPSKTSSSVGNGGIVALGLCDNFFYSPATRDVLYHQAWVLAADGTHVVGSDVFEKGLGDFVRQPRDFINILAGSIAFSEPGSPLRMPIRIPARSIDDITALWQVLADKCDNLSIMWTDGTADASDNLNWYGVWHDGAGYEAYSKHPTTGNPTPNGVSGAWTDYNIGTNPPVTEFDADTSGATEVYRALWTKDNQSNWPIAIKIRFTISDPAVIEGGGAREYEIVCPVGQ